MKKKHRKTQGRPKPEVEEEPKPDSESGSFGPWLRRQREVREIDLREIADASKIGVAYLEALEENRFEILPADVFTKGFLRQYSKYVGLDPEEVVNYYLDARQAEKDQEDEATEELRPPRRSSGPKYMLVILLLAALLVATVWWLSKLREQESAGSGNTSPGVGAPGASSSVATSPTQAASSPTQAASSPTQAASSPTQAAPRTPSHRPDANASSSGAAPDEASADSSGLPGTPTGSANTAEAESRQAGVGDDGNGSQTSPLKVVLDFTGDCWVEAAVDGSRRLAEMRVQGESVQLDADREVAIKVGDFRKVQVQVNGRPFELTEPSGGGSVRNVTIDLALAESLQAGTGELTP